MLTEKASENSIVTVSCKGLYISFLVSLLLEHLLFLIAILHNPFTEIYTIQSPSTTTMTYPITQSFTKATKWGDETRAHPAMKWMEKFTKDAIDNLAYRSGCPYSDWYTDEFMLQKATGEVIYGGKKAWEEGITSIYAPFASHLHDPNFLSCIEREYGWEMVSHVETRS